ncbi:MAG TPA: hypothetical protein VHL34_24790 [Rhizomicrobium sp.]|jgi:hypothetical protein|nr:hypothetical protein [Rhizomicrobium sp.]
MPFQKGQSGNPKGRPSTGQSIAEYIRKLGGEDGKTYVDELHTLGTTSDDPRIRMMAIGLLLDRGFGRPPQDVTLGGQVDTRTTVVHEYHDAPPTK